MRQLRQLKRNQWLLLILITALILGAGLALDLAAHGLVWRLLYSITGEEAPLKQLYGFTEYVGNLTRRQPVTITDAPIRYTDVNPLGVNTFLEDEVEVAKRERQLQMIHDAGFGWIRQQFRWDDLEISGRGDFTDRRHTPILSAWDKYDNIVALAAKYQVQIIARLNSPPTWSQPPGTQSAYTPPANFDDYANYAAAVATHYKGQIRYFQVWNEPNLKSDWGDPTINPEAYTDLLCRAYKALRAVDPAIVVISAALGPTVEITNQNLNDYIFLQRMYDTGAGACFDILAVQGYGLRSGPTDQRMRPMDINYAHNVWIRDLMITNGDAAKPIWISEMAWNPVPNDPSIADRLNFGQVTDAQAARYAVEAYQRAHNEWPWVGVVCYWFFKRAGDAEKNQSWYYFRMVDPDFTPRPVYDAVKQYAKQYVAGR